MLASLVVDLVTGGHQQQVVAWPGGGTRRARRERKTLKGFLGGVVVPAVRIDGWTFTGGTEH